MPRTVHDLLRLWPRFSRSRIGRWAFSRMLGWAIPYTGALRAEITELAVGRAEVRLRERRGLRNHLNSVHAIAIANVLELTTGLAVNSRMAPRQRGIPVRFEIEYLKKARGLLTANAAFKAPDLPLPADWACTGELRNNVGDLCAVFTAYWRVGEAPPA